jgi:hypothetical protein
MNWESDITNWFNETTNQLSNLKIKKSVFVEFIKLDTLNTIDENTDYIKTTPIIINNNKYLVDKHGVIWTHDSENLIVGQMKEKDIIWT